MRNPAITVQGQAFEASLRLMSQLGLTPLARKRLAVVTDEGPAVADLLRDDDDADDDVA